MKRLRPTLTDNVYLVSDSGRGPLGLDSPLGYRVTSKSRGHRCPFLNLKTKVDSFFVKKRTKIQMQKVGHGLK